MYARPITEDDRGYVEANAASRERLRRALDALDEGSGKVGPNGWSRSAALAHLAFWDRVAAVRWGRLLVGAAPVQFDDPTGNLLNDAGLFQWLALPVDEVRREAMAAAE